ncbi:sensor histidine kinase [Pedobacter antarcticus]|uniref:histidine kinase n=2 Tax=Pedobacter antarcticus TaxID=34086 RepID=A0A081PL12_9SPHI|nr:HAMP domain-containing sensor histidine kinase [Pedobacter antarcticus]KEQ31385.1 hypothetical protein N180_07825 [Pedobacter antarcticus 4BY]SDL45713.1 Signal transduction histidine kinase [Pedobacter antarcticus]SFE38940.1 Signal transduction histidine kinase [Pedobacter antarcticus]
MSNNLAQQGDYIFKFLLKRSGGSPYNTWLILIPVLLILTGLSLEVLYFKGFNSPVYLIFLLAVILTAFFCGVKKAFLVSIFTAALSIVFMVFYHSGITLTIFNDVSQFLLFIFALFFLNGIFYLLKLQLRDVEHERMLRQIAEKDLQMHEKRHEDFVHMAVHELKSPITVLKVYVQMIVLKIQKEKFYKNIEMVEKMDHQLDKMLNLVADILDAAKAGSGTIHCVMNDFHINDLLKMSYENVQAIYPVYNIELQTDPANPVINGDRDRLEQVLNNFITNAVKYSSQDKFIKISSRIQDGKVYIGVADKGLGIPESKIKHVFKQFYRVHSLKTQSLPGLGLGLFICEEIIKKHNGQIGVDSREGEGSTFWFCIDIKNDRQKHYR